MSSYSVPDLSSPGPPTFCKQTPNHPHSYAPDVQRISDLPGLRRVSNTIRDPGGWIGILTAFSVFQGEWTGSISPSGGSVLSKLLRSSAFIAQVSVPWIKTLWTQARWIRTLIRHDAPRTVKIGEELHELSPSTSHSSSSRFHYTPTRTWFGTQIAKFGHTLHLHTWPLDSTSLDQQYLSHSHHPNTSCSGNQQHTPDPPEIPLHLLWTHLWQATHWMELSPTPCLHTPHGYFPD